VTDSTIQRYHIGPRLSEMAVHNNTVYLAGQVADDTTLDVKGQTLEVLGHIDRLLEEVGSHKKKILQVTIFLSDIADFDEMNEAWSSWVPQAFTPPRATVQAQLADPAYKVEMQIIAAL
jgi:enamine deaminase RidA (YjgF/YER057c/UK114 family)